MKRKPLSGYLELIKSAAENQNRLKAKRLCEIALKKLPALSYSPLEEYMLYSYLGDVYSYLAEYSHSLDAYYKAYYIASKHHLKPAFIAQSSLLIGYAFLRIINTKQALTQFHLVDQYYQKYGDAILPMNKIWRIYHLIGLAYCYLYQDESAKAQEIIEKKIPPHLAGASDNEYVLLGYHHLKGEYLIATQRYAEARQSFEEYLKINEKIKSPKGELETNMHLAQIELLQNQVDRAIGILRAVFKDSRRLKFNDLTCESALLLSKCYLLKGLPGKSVAIEHRIKPILSTLDTVWFYEKTREFERLFRQLPTAPHPESRIPRILTETLNHHYETSQAKHIIIGNSRPMQEVYQLIEKIAPTNLPVLIQGETGTGKELIAHAVHNGSSRRDKPGLAFNCGAVPESLMESELFGHNRGAFTGAVAEKKGLIELASGGTLFIDEIGNMPPAMQQKLLRVFEEKLLWRVGAEKATPVDTRFILASNRNIEEMVKQKFFREDFFYRINTIVINLPALRDRQDDIPLLIQHFLQKYSQSEIHVSQSVILFLTAYPWPGNVRELENEIKRICILYPNVKLIKESMLSESVRNYKGTAALAKSGLTIKAATDTFQRDFIIKTIQQCRGNMTQAARQLGYARQSLYDKMKQLKIERDAVHEYGD